jgi:putative oxidoreductase
MLTLTLSEPVEEMAVAYFIVHARQGNFFNEGEPALPYCFIFLLLAVAGGGEARSIDAPLAPK